MSSTTYMLDADKPPFTWAGDYDNLLRNAGTDFPDINTVRDLLSAKYRMVLRLSEINGNFYVNGKPCLVRKRKNAAITVYPNCKILEGKPLKYGGSNSYPNISFENDYCIVEVITKGFPHFELKYYNTSNFDQENSALVQLI